MAAVAEQQLLAMQQQLEAVVAMMDEGKNANRRLAKDLAASKLREKHIFLSFSGGGVEASLRPRENGPLEPGVGAAPISIEHAIRQQDDQVRQGRLLGGGALLVCAHIEVTSN